jgi:hypothetical protein
MSAMIVDALGVQLAGTAAAVRAQIAAKKFFWLDIFSGGTSPEILNELGLESADTAWALRFGQTGRMTIGRQTLRATTWLAGPSGDLLEVHLLSTSAMSSRYGTVRLRSWMRSGNNSPSAWAALNKVPITPLEYFCNCCSARLTM